MLSPEALFVKKVLTTFWMVFAGVSVVADLNLIPGVSTILRSIAKRGKEDDDDEEEDRNDGDKKKKDRAAIAAAAAKKKKDDDADASSKNDETTENVEKKKKTTRKAAWWASNLFTVPHSWFAHFYALGLASCAALASVGAATTPIALLVLHCVRRLVEERTLFQPGASTSEMHAGAYAFGLSFYAAAAPLTLAIGRAAQSPELPYLCGGAALFAHLLHLVALWPLGAKLFDGDMPLSWWILLPWVLILPMLALQWFKPRRHSAPLARLMS